MIVPCVSLAALQACDSLTCCSFVSIKPYFSKIAAKVVQIFGIRKFFQWKINFSHLSAGSEAYVITDSVRIEQQVPMVQATGTERIKNIFIRIRITQ